MHCVHCMLSTCFDVFRIFVQDVGVNHKSPEFRVGDTNVNCHPRFSNNTTHNSPKHAISDEFTFFSSEDSLVPLLPSRPNSLLPTKPSASQNSSHIYTCGIMPIVIVQQNAQNYSSLQWHSEYQGPKTTSFLDHSIQNS